MKIIAARYLEDHEPLYLYRCDSCEHEFAERGAKCDHFYTTIVPSLHCPQCGFAGRSSSGPYAWRSINPDDVAWPKGGSDHKGAHHEASTQRREEDRLARALANGKEIGQTVGFSMNIQRAAGVRASIFVRGQETAAQQEMIRQSQAEFRSWLQSPPRHLNCRTRGIPIVTEMQELEASMADLGVASLLARERER